MKNDTDPRPTKHKPQGQVELQAARRCENRRGAAPSICTLFTHPECALHDPGKTHPDRPERLHAVLRALGGPEFGALARGSGERADMDDILLAHSREYFDRVRASVPSTGLRNIESETILSPGSLAAALRAAGLVCAAVDAIFAGHTRNAFCAVRPPGHHAERENAMGFCIFNNVAIGALRARHRFGARRLAVIDFDTHHGNGAQNIFWDDADACVVSIHEHPSDMITGDADERGGYGTILNLPLLPESGGAAFRDAFKGRLIPHVRTFQPDIILVAAGFDGHRDDPVGRMGLDSADYVWTGHQLVKLADECCGGRLVASLEGGYDNDALGLCVAGFIAGMMSEQESS